MQQKVENGAKASKKIAIFKTANTSIGIALINRILNDYAHVFEDYQTAILEKHHQYIISNKPGLFYTSISCTSIGM